MTDATGRAGESAGARSTSGGFTLPGEAGHEAFTLAMAQRWGADVIRDSDGTRLSEEILDSGHGVYSTLCLVREDNDWAKENPHRLQQNFLMSAPVTAEGPQVVIELLAGYSRDQFVVNDWEGVREFWQVFDRTTAAEVSRDDWDLVGDGRVVVRAATPWHRYTVNFLVTRIWEEISMYNHVTNDWGEMEHLRAVEPRYPEVQERLLQALEDWCVSHPHTTVVRFTSLFYNFAWFWGDNPTLPHVYSDWGSYDFTVTPLALREFAATTGLSITSEDFVNAGRYTSTHNQPSRLYRAWMDFVGDFVLELGRRCVEVVHRHGKKAFVFYDDSWIGLEPYSGRFQEFGFDGLIKAVFSGYEARLCAGADVATHELRLHPYLFPVDLQGRPTFSAGGHPERDASRYWVSVRRALLRASVERIGLGGYLSLVEPFEEFQDFMAQVADEHRLIRSLHAAGGPQMATTRVAILTAWGALRTWTCSGHLHEHPDAILTHVLESLSGLPFEVRFLDFDQIENEGVPEDVDVLVNAGLAGDAWSGADSWRRAAVTTAITGFVAAGGGFVGVGQPSATDLSTQFFQLAAVLGADQDTGDRRCLNRRAFDVVDHPVLDGTDGSDLPLQRGVFLTGDDSEVFAAVEGTPVGVAATFHQGRSVYLSGHAHAPSAARRLDNAIRWAGRAASGDHRTSNPQTEVASFPQSSTFLVVNNSQDEQVTDVRGPDGVVATVRVSGGGMTVLEL